MAQQKCDLTQLETKFASLKAEPHVENLKALEFILSLNKAVNFDEILVRQGFEAYPQQQQLETKKSIQPFTTFFEYMRDNLESIESKYLQESGDQQQIQQARKEGDHTNYNFLLNKNSVSKFIRDEANHYQKVLEQYLEGGEGEQKAVSTPQLHNFLIDLFRHPCATIIIDGKPYLQRPTVDIQLDIGGSLSRYAIQQRQVSPQQAAQQFRIPEEEMLDFLTFWLQENTTLYVLYARTKERIRREAAFLTQNANSAPTHPAAMTGQEIVQQLHQLEQKEEGGNSKMANSSLKQTHSRAQNLADGIKPMGMSNVSQFEQLQEGRNEIVEVTELSQEEILRRELKGLFEFGCKRKYRLNKNTTFGEIAQESNSMDLDKFMYFCCFFELNSLISRELLVEYFKLFAANMRVLDFRSFEKVVMRMVASQPRAAQHLLSKIKFDHRLKNKQIRQNRKGGNHPSKYKFALHPINGKDVSSIQKQLSFRKLQKMIVKEEKDVKALAKREQRDRADKAEQSRVEKAREVGRNYSTRGGAKLSTLDLEVIRDNRFNPESLVSQNCESDRLWEAYQAKIWRKQEKGGSALESILTRRMQKGHSVLSKINSELSFLHH